MSLMHDASQYGSFKDLVDDSGAPTVSAREYKMESWRLTYQVQVRCLASCLLRKRWPQTGDLNSPQLTSTTISRLDRSHAPAIRVLYGLRSQSPKELHCLPRLQVCPSWLSLRRNIKYTDGTSWAIQDSNYVLVREDPERNPFIRFWGEPGWRIL